MENNKSNKNTIITISVIEAIRFLVRSGLSIEESKKLLKK
jgi:hypothetical protein